MSRRNARRLAPGVQIPRRTVEDLVAVRVPRLYRTFAKAFFTLFRLLPAGSRFRRAVIMRLAQRSYDAFMRRDLETLLAIYHPELEWDTTRFRDWPESRIYHGLEGLREWFNDWWAAFDEFRAEIRDVRDLGGTRAILIVEMRAKGRGSGVEVAFPWVQVGAVQDGLISQVRNFSDYPEALEAVGPRGQALPQRADPVR
jgi:ketosteroid isomerase-like protein